VLAERDNDLSIKLIDFGLAVKLLPGARIQSPVGTPGYVAPEIVLGLEYGECSCSL
jgi:calcium-dependent protein kinase